MKKIFKLFQISNLGFNLTELMTATAVVGILSTVGISSYRAQQDKAKAAEAKYSLSSLYSSEQQFKENWNRYHENLVLVQAVPIGKQNYDVGFVNTGPLDALPNVPNAYAQEVKCNSWEQLCNDECPDAVETTAGGSSTDATKSKYLQRNYFSCSVKSNLFVKDYTGTDEYKADDTTFKAMARGEMDAEDRWSIDQDQILVHELDGSN